MKIIVHEANGLQIGQRREDGYINLTQMAQASGKLIADYLRLDTTKAFLKELSRSMEIPIDQLIIKIVTGQNNKRGSWGHPQIAIHCGQWCSPEFAVLVSRWVFEWITTGQNLVSSQSTEIPTDINTALDQLVVCQKINDG